MKYAILRTDKASDQLYAILQYIAEDSGSVETALKYLDMLEEKIMLLASNPHMGSYPRYSILRKQGYRVLIIQRHLVFYKADDDKHEIMIYAIVDARQQYLDLL